MPALQRALGFDAAGLQWIPNAYVVAFGGLLLLGRRLADLYGPRRLFGIGFVVLTAASLVAGTATSAAALLIMVLMMMATEKVVGRLGPKAS